MLPSLCNMNHDQGDTHLDATVNHLCPTICANNTHIYKYMSPNVYS